uniref:Uncharacterized protein n=1 Tax=Castor canadensis TaxID=51338 RepID=A0A8C0ZVQ1_CASCN
MQELLLQYRIVPIFQAHHSCSLSLQGLHQACIPSPYRDIDHLGMHKKAIQIQKQKQNKLIKIKKNCFI